MNNFKKFLLPAVMVLAGTASAFATHAAKDDSKAPRPGYVFHAGENPQCIEANKLCETQGIITCTGDIGMGTEPLYDLNGSSCPNVLKERVVK